MAKSPPNYFSCAKCGWRGILAGNATHECERTAADMMSRMNDARRSVAAATPAPAISQPDDASSNPSDEPGEPQAERLERDVRAMLDRPVTIAYVHRAHAGIGTFDVHQGCSACRDEITTNNVRGDRTYFATLAIIAIAVRKAWVTHRCRPVEASLQALSPADLDELHQNIDLEIDRLAKRQVEIKALLDKRNGAA